MTFAKTVAVVLLSAGVMSHAVAAGGYVGGSVGKSSLDDGCDGAGVLGFTSCDDSDTGWKVFGGYEINENLAVEGAWVDLGEASATGGGVSVTGEADAIVLDVKGTLPIGEQFGVFGKLGVAFWDAEYSGTGPGGSVSVSEDGNDLTYGLGAEYSFSEQFGVRGEWERFDVDDGDVDLMSIGAFVKF